MTPGFRVVATENIPEPAIDRFVTEWAEMAPMGERERLLLRIAEPPAIVQVVGGLLDWTLPFKLAATAFAAQLGKNAGDDVWKNKAAIQRALQERSTQVLYRASAALLQLGTSVPHPLQLIVGLNFPDPHFGPSFRIVPDDPEGGAARIAALVLKGEQLQHLLREHDKGTGPLGPVHLELEESGEVTVRWMGLDLNEHIRTI